jgi:protease I
MKRTRRFVLLALVLSAAFFPAGGVFAGGPLSGKKILMIIAPRNFQDIEYSAAKTTFENAGASITLASNKKGTAKGMSGTMVPVSNGLGDVKASDYDAVVFIGGPGSTVFWDDPKAQAIAREAVFSRKVLAAICLAPVTLARAGVLGGKNCTVWPDAQGKLKEKGCRYVDRPVVTDGKIVTGNGPDAAQAFARAVVAALR